MLYELASFEGFFGPLRLFRYLSFRCGFALALSFIVAMVIAPPIIRYLRKFKYEGTQRTEEDLGILAKLHADKRNTPQMGGIIVYIAVMAGVLLFARPTFLVFVALFVYTVLTVLGFADDYKKLVRKSPDGISGKTKLAVQVAVSLAALCMLYFSEEYGGIMRELWVPFLKSPLIATMPFWFMFVFFFFVIGGSSNALNLTDGVDGLAIGCTITTALAYGIFSYVSGNTIAAEYLFLRYVPQCGELTVICCALLGASLAFLWYNAHPADIFMGDTGSLALGGLIGVIAIMTLQPITLVIIGGVSVMEAMSVILQVGSYKIRKKRIFRRSPIHHHFEEGGWAETRIIVRFWIISLICALAGLATLKLR